MQGAGGRWLDGAVPLAGWVRAIAAHDLWTSAFAAMVLLWVASAAAVVAVRARKRSHD